MKDHNVTLYRQATVLLKRHEGLRLQPYKCTADKLTIGYGHNIEAKGLPEEVQAHLDKFGKITEHQAVMMLQMDIFDCIDDLATLPYWTKMPGPVKAALVDLRFCVGDAGYHKFRKMEAALMEENYEEAAAQILDSLFAHQTGARARDLATIVEMG